MIARSGTLLFLLFACCGIALAAEEATDPGRPAAIATQDVPRIPAEVFDRLRAYQNVRTASFAGWAPDGRGILIATRFGNSVQLHRVYDPGGRREQITFFDEPVSGQFIPHSKDNAVLMSMSRGGDENFQIYLLEPQSYRWELLTDGKSRNLLGPIQRDGLRMIVHSNQRNGRDTDLYLADPRRPHSLKMALETSGEYWVATDFSPDGKSVLALHYVSANESHPAILDLETRKLHKLPVPGAETASQDRQVSFGNLAYSKEGRHVYVTTDARGEFQELARFDPASQQYQWLTQDIPWDVDSIRVDPVSGTVAFTINEDGASRLYVLRDDRRQDVNIPLGIVDGLEFSPDGSRLGFSLSQPNVPAEAYCVSLDDLPDAKLTRWTYSETGGLDPASFIRPERISFPSFDGRKIPAYVYRPRGASATARSPVLLMIHGGPESQYRPDFAGISQYLLNDLGIAVICPNVRGSAGYGKTYLTLDNAQLREDSVKDIGALLDWIAKQPDLDPSRVAVYGGSYGGYMVLASLVQFGDRIRAGVDIVGIANFITFLEQTSPYRQDLRRAEYGDERDPKMRAVFERINPAANAAKIRSALLVAHGRNDPRVPFSEAKQIADEVRAAGRSVWTLYADNEGHGFAKKDNRDYLTAVMAVFLQRHLQD